ncbi:hypothetical protein BU26DRAFT_27559 [Trematosphaeria pertusa]|uniref:Voltage-gated hydrogen channel 1 n=1 Tax=Trematosphaeria pertusa TaxID=390896 RepID=A0A6A6J5D2_9PLEO|nr:uncharacterized protein BU26DRAFT_27559 [Trematosphaeria pertusa]KAF2256683.1 hypothetical protein BU26DRAFT_27559 [Trematosphaeria pertusa]
MSSSPLLQPYERLCEAPERTPSFRRRLYQYFSSKTFHYSVLLLVTLDVGCMFADIIINLMTCDRKTPAADKALEVLGYVSLVFSALFMLELFASIWAFGRSYFKSKFHVFDATIIVVSFIFEVSLQGVEEELASLIVILRLMRVVKIIDEISVGAQEEMKGLEEKLMQSEKEVQELREEVEKLKKLQNEVV